MITLLVNIGIVITAILHLFFFILEIFFWKKPLGLKTFRMDQQFAIQSASLAANQGLYNGFLSAGLYWSLLVKNPEQSLQLKIFFLSWVLIAGIYAGLTVSRRILLIQALPAALTLILLWIQTL